MKILKILLAILLVLIAVVVAGGLIMENTFDVEEQTVISAPPEAIHAYVADLKHWPEWSPFMKDDDTLVTTLGEDTTGVGANQSWKSKKQGDGRLVITEADPKTGVAMDLFFQGGDEEMPASKSRIRYEPTDGGTRVAWSFAGELDLPILGPWLALYVEHFVSDAYERGLADLKAAVETKPIAPTPAGMGK